MTGKKIHIEQRAPKLLIVPLNAVETQVFALGENNRIIAPKPCTIWSESHKNIVKKTLEYASLLDLDKGYFVIAGVYHFGHTLADTLGPLFHFITKERGDNKTKALMFNTNHSIKIMTRLLGVEQGLKHFYSSSPVLLRSRKGFQLIDGNEGINNLEHGYRLALAAYVGRKLDGYCHVSETLQSCKGKKIFLSSRRHSRIANLDEIVKTLKDSGWEYVDPIENTLIQVLAKIRYAKTLVSENGSILFNAFLSRETSYRVLCSERCLNVHQEDKHEYSGFRYNSIHAGLMQYHACRSIAHSTKHPFADIIYVNSSEFL